MQKKKKRALFITTVNLEMNSGGTSYSNSVLKSFPDDFVVEKLVLDEYQLIMSRRVRWLFSILKSAFTAIPFNVIFHSGILRNEAKGLLREPWDLVVFDHLESSYMLREKSDASYIYVSHNREADVVHQKIFGVFSYLSKLLALWIENYEVKLSRAVGGIVSISNEESRWYAESCSNVEVLYPVFSIHGCRFKLPNKSPVLRVGFLGSRSWKPNCEAVEILISDVFPRIQRSIEFVLAGAGWSDSDVISRMDPIGKVVKAKVQILGYVPEIERFWRSIDIFAAPIISGAGVNVKVCESLAVGVPVIALDHALRGLPENVTSSGLVFAAKSLSEFSALIDDYKNNEVDPEGFVFREFTYTYAREVLARVIDKAMHKSI